MFEGLAYLEQGVSVMSLPHHHRPLERETDEETTVLSRRAVLHRSFLGIAGVGVITLLAACGGDDGDDIVDGPIVDEPIDDDGMATPGD